jgi:histidinol-phosphate/aromatic aminotransferase/cobyric acid decarboxylase-like protein/choline kinase
MQVIILAAGMGKRLGTLTQNNTKAMIEINGTSLISRLLNQLSSKELERIIIVTGYEGEKLKQHISLNHSNLNIQYIDNPVYHQTNNIYSLWLTRDLFQEDDTLLFESDLIFDDVIIDKLLESPYQDAAVVAKYQSWMDGTMVQLDTNDFIINFIPKKAFDYKNTDFYYKTVNIYKFGKSFIQSTYLPFLEAYIKANGNNEYYEQVLRVITFFDNFKLKAISLQNEKWYEIDDIQDLDIAQTLFGEDDNKLSLYQKRYGGYWRFGKLLDFCYLVNPFFPPSQMVDELKSNFEVLLREYPSGLSVNNLLAGKYFGVKQDYICVGNGAAELIKGLTDTLQGKMGIIFPTFEEYPNRTSEDKIVAFTSDNPDFSYTISEVQDFFAPKDISSLLIINPDNPSGNFLPIKDIISLITWCQAKSILLIVDESFVDFSDYEENKTLLENTILEKYSNLTVVKSISKSYGVPGLRLGVLATSDSSVLEAVKKNLSIWNINSFAEYYMQIFSKYEKEYRFGCQAFIQERKTFYNELQSVNFLRVIPSQANYFLCEITQKYTATELTKILLIQYNILIKDCSKKIGFDNRNYIRIAVRSREDNKRLLHAFKTLK